MADRREEKERLRKARVAAERQDMRSGRQRLLGGYIVAGVLTAAVVIGIVIVIAGGSGDDGGGAASGEGAPENAFIDPNLGVVAAETDGREGTPPPPVEQARLGKAAKIAGCDLKLDLPDEGSSHFSKEQEGEYKTQPPTSGDHYSSPAEAGSGALAEGAYVETPPPSRGVHAFEHGRVEIQYSPDLSEEDQLAIKGAFDEDPNGLVLFPNADMPYEVAVTAWTNLLGCKTFDDGATLDAIRAFRDTFRGRGPEPVPL
jgi:hypothetical protein